MSGEDKALELYRRVREDDLALGAIDVGEVVAPRSADEFRSLEQGGYRLVRLLSPGEGERLARATIEQLRRARLERSDAYDVSGGPTRRDLRLMNLPEGMREERVQDMCGRRIDRIASVSGVVGGTYQEISFVGTLKRPRAVAFVMFRADVDVASLARRRVDGVERDGDGWILLTRGRPGAFFRFAGDGDRIPLRSSPIRPLSEG